MYEVQCSECDGSQSTSKQSRDVTRKIGLLYMRWTKATPSTGRKPAWRSRRRATGKEECKKPSGSIDYLTQWTWITAWYWATSGHQCWNFADSNNINFYHLFIDHGYARACVQSPLIFITSIPSSHIIPQCTADKRLFSRNVLSVNCFMLCISLKEVDVIE